MGRPSTGRRERPSTLPEVIAAWPEIADIAELNTPLGALGQILSNFFRRGNTTGFDTSRIINAFDASISEVEEEARARTQLASDMQTQILSNISKMKAALILVVVFTVVTLIFAYFSLPNHARLIEAFKADRSWFIQDENMAFTSVFAGSIFSALFLSVCIVRSYGCNKAIILFVIAYGLFCLLQIIGLLLVYKTETMSSIDTGIGFLLASQIANGLLLIGAAVFSFPKTAIGKLVGAGIGTLVALTGIHNPSSLLHARINKAKSHSDVEAKLKNP